MPTLNPPGAPNTMLVSVPVPTPVPNKQTAAPTATAPVQPKSPQAASVFRKTGANHSLILPYPDDQSGPSDPGASRAAFRQVLRSPTKQMAKEEKPVRFSKWETGKHGTESWNPKPHPDAGDEQEVIAKRKDDPLWQYHRGQIDYTGNATAPNARLANAGTSGYAVIHTQQHHTAHRNSAAKPPEGMVELPPELIKVSERHFAPKPKDKRKRFAAKEKPKRFSAETRYDRPIHPDVANLLKSSPLIAADFMEDEDANNGRLMPETARAIRMGERLHQIPYGDVAQNMPEYHKSRTDVTPYELHISPMVHSEPSKSFDKWWEVRLNDEHGNLKSNYVTTDMSHIDGLVKENSGGHYSFERLANMLNANADRAHLLGDRYQTLFRQLHEFYNLTQKQRHKKFLEHIKEPVQLAHKTSPKRFAGIDLLKKAKDTLAKKSQTKAQDPSKVFGQDVFKLAASKPLVGSPFITKTPLVHIDSGVSAQRMIDTFGRVPHPQDLAAMVNGVDGTSIQIVKPTFSDDKGVLAFVKHMDAPDSYRAVRYLDPDGVVNNDFFRKDDESPVRARGSDILRAQAEALARHDFTRINTHAAGNPKELRKLNAGIRGSMIGYFVWPQLGFDGELSPGHIHRLRAAGINLDPDERHRILDYINDPEFNEAWKHHAGNDIDADFDLTPNSQSWQQLNRKTKWFEGDKSPHEDKI